MKKKKLLKLITFYVIISFVVVINIQVNFDFFTSRDIRNKHLIQMGQQEAYAAAMSVYNKYEVVRELDIDWYDVGYTTYSYSHMESRDRFYKKLSFNNGRFSVSELATFDELLAEAVGIFYYACEGDSVYQAIIIWEPDYSFCWFYACRAKSSEVDYTYSKGDLVQSNIVAVDGTYPKNGRYTDGYWYQKVTMIPTFNISSPSPNGTFAESFIPVISVSDPDGDILTCKYYLDSEMIPRDTKQISNTATAQNVSFNMLDIGPLSQGAHTITFEVSDGKADPVSETVAFSIDKMPPEINSVICTTSDTRITVSGSVKEGTADLHELPYRYTVNDVQSQWMTNTSYTAGSLSPNTNYSVKFEARDRFGNTAAEQLNVYTKAQKPTVSIIGITESTLNLEISDSNPSGTPYQAKVGTKYANASGNLTETPQWITLINKNITIKGLQSNTQYTVSIKARNAEGIETAAAESSHMTLALSPAITFPEIRQTYIKLEWSAVSGVTSYIIEVDGINKGQVTGTEYVHANLVPETEHKYRLKAINTGGEGNWGDYYSATTLPYPPAAPVNIEASETQTSITLSWDRVAKATGYEIEIDEDVFPVGVGDVLTYVHKGLAPDTEHKYRIRAKNAGGVSEWSEYIVKKTLPEPPPVPAEIKVQKTHTSITLTWLLSERAVAYTVEADGQVIDNNDKTSFIHEGLLPLSRHTYRIKALNRGGDSGWSEEIIVITHPDKPKTPSNIIAASDQSSISLTWYEVPYAESYDVEINGYVAADTTGASCKLEGFEPDSLYTCRIKAVNVTGTSEWSNPVSIWTLPEPTGGGDGAADTSLTNVVAVITNNTITLSWDSIEHDGEYEIEVDGNLYDNGKSTAYSHTGLEAETYHTYKIRVKNSEETDEWCTVLSLSTMPDIPDAPKGLMAFATDYSIELRWDRVDGADGYDIEADGNVVDAGALENYMHNALEPGTTHTYRIRAKNISGVTVWSEAIAISTTNPTYELECINNKEYGLSLMMSDVKDFTGLKLIVAYDSNKLEITDLCGFTPVRDLMSEGAIPGTKLFVKFEPGRIEFTVRDSIAPGTMWSGEVTDIIFRAKINGKAQLNFYAVPD